MQEGFVNINNVPTKILTWGKWIEQTFTENEPKDIILCIPGNPGITTFYKSFLESIHEQTGHPVWIIGHAGHETQNSRNLYDIPPLKNNEKLYDLQGQINHKLSFIEKYVPDDAKLHLIGHSIGAYIILNLLKNPSISSKIVYSYLLFPTIEHMAETPNGLYITKTLPPIFSILSFISWIVSTLPLFLQTFLLFIYFYVQDIPKDHFESFRTVINPYIVGNIYHMAMDEMQNVHCRNDEVLRLNKNIKLYYGCCDGWVPISYYDRIKDDIVGIDAELCTNGFAHAFVLKDSKPVATIVTSWIKQIEMLRKTSLK